MTTQVPNAHTYTPASAALADHWAAFVAFATSSLQHWTPDFQATDRLVLRQGAQQMRLHYDSVSGNVLGQLDPLGTMTDAQGTGASASACEEVVIIANATFAARGVIAEYDDAMYWGLYGATLENVEQATHFGIVVTPFNADDDAHITGHGVFAGSPRFTSSSGAEVWASPTSGQRTRIRIGVNDWDSVQAQANQTTDGGVVAGRVRYPPIIVETNGVATSTSSGTPFAFTRYIRQASAAEYNRVVRPSTQSDQAWLHVGYNTSTSPLLMLWDKTVTP